VIKKVISILVQANFKCIGTDGQAGMKETKFHQHDKMIAKAKPEHRQLSFNHPSLFSRRE
jgi:hypothetical protein